MSFRVGDPIFNHRGEPGTVIDSGQLGKLVVDSKRAAVEEQFRHGYIQGLDPASRHEFYAILDEVRALDNPEEKVAILQAKIDTLEQTITPHARQMLGYVKSELAHVMATYQYKPRYYTIPATRTA